MGSPALLVGYHYLAILAPGVELHRMVELLLLDSFTAILELSRRSFAQPRNQSSRRVSCQCIR